MFNELDSSSFSLQSGRVCHSCLPYRHTWRYETCEHCLFVLTTLGITYRRLFFPLSPINRTMEPPPTSVETVADGLAAGTHAQYSPAEAFGLLGLLGPNHDLPSDDASNGHSPQVAGHGSQRTSIQTNVPTIWNSEGPTAEQGKPIKQHASSPSVASPSDTDHAEATEPHSTVPDIRIACQNCKQRKLTCAAGIDGT